jgi:hypothetical protein
VPGSAAGFREKDQDLLAGSAVAECKDKIPICLLNCKDGIDRRPAEIGVRLLKAFPGDLQIAAVLSTPKFRNKGCVNRTP